MVDSRDSTERDGQSASLESRMQEVELRVADADEKVSGLAMSIDRRFDTLDMALREQREYAEFVHARLQPGLTALEMSVQALTFRFKLLHRKVDGLETSLHRLGDRVGQVEGRMDGLEARMDGLEIRMDRLEVRMDGLEARMDRLEARMDGLEVRMERLEAKLDHLAADFRRFEDKLDRLLQREQQR